MTQTAEIIDIFVHTIASDKDYQLKELKRILTEVYNSKSSKKKIPKAVEKNDTSSDSDEDKPKKRGRPAKVKLDKNGDIKVKKAPSAYNIYVKQTIEAMKKDNPDAPAKELMGLAANKWKSLTQEEKDSYKVQV